jgi:hypothetical protein
MQRGLAVRSFRLVSSVNSAIDVDAADDGEATNAIDPACKSLPRVDPTLRTSSASGISHVPGVTCLEGCHAGEGGEARTRFAAAGTIYRSQTSRELAPSSGSVQGVGGTSLEIDRCGNFYAVVGALKTAIDETQPFVQNPTVHRMEKSLVNQPNAGSCNQFGCHDLRRKLTWGVYN